MRVKTSIHWKILIPIIASLAACMSFYSFYYVHKIEANALERFRVSSRNFAETAADNVDHYFDNCTSAAKSVYANHTLMLALTTKGATHISTSDEDRSEVLNYLRTICYAMPSAVQVYLVLPENEISFLYIPNQFVFSTSSSDFIYPDSERFGSYLDVYFENVHPKTSYGHTISYSQSYHNHEPVFTIWVPIVNIPYGVEQKGYIAVDITTSFLVKNCTPDLDNAEQTFLLTDTGMIMASNDEQNIGRQIQDVLPELQWDAGRAYESGENVVVQADFHTDLVSGYFLKVTPTSAIFDDTTWNAMGLLVIFIALLTGFLVFSIFSILRYTRPLIKLTMIMAEIACKKNWQSEVSVSQIIQYSKKDELGTLIQTFDQMMAALHHARIRQYDLELLNINATLKMLQAQINPHFIYNTLQFFAASALQCSNTALYSGLSSFGQMLHYSMVIEPALATLNQEIDYIRRYISLQQARFQYFEPAEIDIDPQAGKITIPKMSIIPLVENSFKYGKLYRKPGSLLKIRAGISEEWLTIAVVDNGAAIAPDVAADLMRDIQAIRDGLSDYTETLGLDQWGSVSRAYDSTSIGIRNVYIRLALHFGNCRFRIYPNELGGTTVELEIPLSPPPRGTIIL